MPLFAAIGLDHAPHSMAKRREAQLEHRLYVRRHDEKIRLVGVMLDDSDNQCGSFYLFEAENEQQVLDWFAGEPFFQGDVYENLIVRRFMLGRNIAEQRDWGISIEEIESGPA